MSTPAEQLELQLRGARDAQGRFLSGRGGPAPSLAGTQLELEFGRRPPTPRFTLTSPPSPPVQGELNLGPQPTGPATAPRPTVSPTLGTPYGGAINPSLAGMQVGGTAPGVSTVTPPTTPATPATSARPATGSTLGPGARGILGIGGAGEAVNFLGDMITNPDESDLATTIARGGEFGGRLASGGLGMILADRLLSRTPAGRIIRFLGQLAGFELGSSAPGVVSHLTGVELPSERLRAAREAAGVPEPTLADTIGGVVTGLQNLSRGVSSSRASTVTPGAETPAETPAVDETGTSPITATAVPGVFQRPGGLGETEFFNLRPDGTVPSPLAGGGTMTTVPAAFFANGGAGTRTAAAPSAGTGLAAMAGAAPGQDVNAMRQDYERRLNEFRDWYRRTSVDERGRPLVGRLASAHAAQANVMARILLPENFNAPPPGLAGIQPGDDWVAKELFRHQLGRAAALSDAQINAALEDRRATRAQGWKFEPPQMVGQPGILTDEAGRQHLVTPEEAQILPAQWKSFVEQTGQQMSLGDYIIALRARQLNQPPAQEEPNWLGRLLGMS